MKYVAYYRVSTEKQGESGLGLKAQRRTIQEFVKSRSGNLIAEYEEVKSGGKNDRAILMEAIKQCKLQGATLLVAKLDRISRNAAFIATLQDTRVPFTICDMPGVDSFVINMFGALAQKEREMISERVKAGLKSTKLLGQPLGFGHLHSKDIVMKANRRALETIKAKADLFADKRIDVIYEWRAMGKTYAQIAQRLNEQEVPTARGGKWYPTTVKNVLDRGQKEEE